MTSKLRFLHILLAKIPHTSHLLIDLWSLIFREPCSLKVSGAASSCNLALKIKTGHIHSNKKQKIQFIKRNHVNARSPEKICAGNHQNRHITQHIHSFFLPGHIHRHLHLCVFLNPSPLSVFSHCDMSLCWLDGTSCGPSTLTRPALRFQWCTAHIYKQKTKVPVNWIPASPLC